MTDLFKDMWYHIFWEEMSETQKIKVIGQPIDYPMDCQ